MRQRRRPQPRPWRQGGAGERAVGEISEQIGHPGNVPHKQGPQPWSKGSPLGKGQSLQHTVLGPLDVHVQNRESHTQILHSAQTGLWKGSVPSRGDPEARRPRPGPRATPLPTADRARSGSRELIKSNEMPLRGETMGEPRPDAAEADLKHG